MLVFKRSLLAYVTQPTHDGPPGIVLIPESKRVALRISLSTADACVKESRRVRRRERVQHFCFTPKAESAPSSGLPCGFEGLPPLPPLSADSPQPLLTHSPSGLRSPYPGAERLREW